MDNIRQVYENQGFVLLPEAIPARQIDSLLDRYLGLVHEVAGCHFSDPNGADLIAFYNQHPEIESRIYADIRRLPWLEQFGRLNAIVEPVRQLLGARIGLFRKVPFRIDVPQWTHELAHWHQDYFYVKGNTDVITAWIPMQDTTFINGCISIMPRSHRLGPLKHDLVIGKKHVPCGIFQNEIRMVEMKKGDLLLFNTLLLHSGNLNLSNGIRYSIQARYTPLDANTDEEMGGVIPLQEAAR
jgi:hypothetical protein